MGGEACVDLAKAMEGTSDPGAGVEEPPGAGDVQRLEMSCDRIALEPPGKSSRV
jgi:hypothetical protein